MSRIKLPAVLALLTACVIAFAWVGYYGSDDQSYADGGLGWLDHFPYVGDSHWTLRHTVVIPMAIAFRLFGVSEFTLVLPTLMYFAALLCLVYLILDRYFERTVAAAAVLVLMTLPLMAVQATIVVPDFAEVFFCLLSLFLFFEATRAERPHRLLVLAGVAAGFSWLTRETVVFFLFTYAVLFVVGYGVPRRLYFLMAAGFLAVFGVECVYFGIMTGDPLYRVVSDLRTHLRVNASTAGISGIIEALEKAMSRTEVVKGYGGLSRTGNLQVNRFIDPILAVTANHFLMFLYYFAAPAAIHTVFFNKRLDERQQRFVRLFGLTALVWFTFLYFQVGMSLLARYFMLPTVIVTMLFAVWIEAMLPRRRSLVVAMLGFIALTNLGGVYLDDRDPIFAERALRDFAKEHDEKIYTDPQTANRGRFLFRLAGVDDRIVGGLPPKGALYFYNPKYVDWGAQAVDPLAQRAQLAPYLPQPGWTVVWRRESPRKLGGLIVDALGLGRHIPPGIYRRLAKPAPDVAVYRP